MWQMRSQGSAAPVRSGKLKPKDAEVQCQRRLDRGLGKTELFGDIDIKQVF